MRLEALQTLQLRRDLFSLSLSLSLSPDISARYIRGLLPCRNAPGTELRIRIPCIEQRTSSCWTRVARPRSKANTWLGFPAPHINCMYECVCVHIYISIIYIYIYIYLFIYLYIYLFAMCSRHLLYVHGGYQVLYHHILKTLYALRRLYQTLAPKCPRPATLSSGEPESTTKRRAP